MPAHSHESPRTSAVLDRTFAALAHPVRRAMLSRLARGEVATVSALAQPFDMTLMAVSKHLRQMEEAGLVRRRKVGREQWCSMAPGALDRARDWIELHREFWTNALQSLGDYLEDEARAQAPRHPHNPHDHAGGKKR